MPTVLSVTMAIGSHRLSQQGAITKRMTAIEEMAGMDVLCSEKTGTLTLNKLTVDKNLIEVCILKLIIITVWCHFCFLFSILIFREKKLVWQPIFEILFWEVSEKATHLF